jgi:hypothetical protein
MISVNVRYRTAAGRAGRLDKTQRAARLGGRQLGGEDIAVEPGGRASAKSVLEWLSGVAALLLRWSGCFDFRGFRRTGCSGLVSV